MRIGRRAVLAGAAGLVAGRAAASPRWRPRDLDGYWTGASYTDLQRPKELSKPTLTPAEAEAWEAPRRANGGMPPSKAGDVGQAESEFNERGAGMLRLGGEIRASLIVDPPDGRIPYRAEFAAAQGIGLPPTERIDGPEQRPGNERCLTSPLSAAPMIPGPDANVLQFVQAPGVLAIVCEKYHEVRVIPLSGTPAPLRPTPSWTGVSAGRWDGETLVGETAGFREGVTNRGQGFFVTGATRVVERFTRTAADAILYDVTVADPEMLTRPWRAELKLVPAGRIFEYACHEGNYGLPDILRIARQAEGR
jgi:hypothetical protein